MSREIDNESVYGDKYIGTKIRQYEDKINTNFQGKEVPKNESYKCLSFKMVKKYYPQTFLEECKYEIKKKKKMVNLIEDDFDHSSDESDNEEFK